MLDWLRELREALCNICIAPTVTFGRMTRNHLTIKIPAH
jgi:hypothetical protein